MSGLPVNTRIGILKPLYTKESEIVELGNDSKRNLLLLTINHQRQGNLFSSCNCTIISQRNLERMSYPMLQPAFAGSFNLLELLLVYKIMGHTTVNHGSKLGTMQADWCSHQFRLNLHGRYKTSKWIGSPVKNRGCRWLW